MKKSWYHDSLWHRQFVDFWTIPHVLFGMFSALVLAYFGFSLLAGLTVTTVAAIFWEIAEIASGESDEVFSNKVSDVIVAALGYIVMWSIVYMSAPDSATLKIWIVVGAAVLAVINFIGWLGFYFWHTGR